MGNKGISDNDLPTVVQVYLNSSDRDARYGPKYGGGLVYNFTSDPERFLPRILERLVYDDSFNVSEKMIYDAKVKNDLLHFVRTRPQARQALVDQMQLARKKNKIDCENFIKTAMENGKSGGLITAVVDSMNKKEQDLLRTLGMVRKSKPSVMDRIKKLFMPTYFRDIQPRQILGNEPRGEAATQVSSLRLEAGASSVAVEPERCSPASPEMVAMRRLDDEIEQDEEKALKQADDKVRASQDEGVRGGPQEERGMTED